MNEKMIVLCRAGYLSVLLAGGRVPQLENRKEGKLRRSLAGNQPITLPSPGTEQKDFINLVNECFEAVFVETCTTCFKNQKTQWLLSELNRTVVIPKDETAAVCDWLAKELIEQTLQKAREEISQSLSKK